MASLLIVEDQDAMRAQLRDFVQLAYPGCFVLEAVDGAVALAAWVLHQPDVVLMDIELPDLNGILLTAYLTARYPDARVIVVSEHAARVYRDRAMNAGAFGYVTKDKLATQLVPLLERAILVAGRNRRP